MLIDATARAALRLQIEKRTATHPAKNIETARVLIMQHAARLKKEEHYANNPEALRIRVLWDTIYIFITSPYLCDVLYKIPGCYGDHVATAAKKVFREMDLLNLDDLDTL